MTRGSSFDSTEVVAFPIRLSILNLEPSAVSLLVERPHSMNSGLEEQPKPQRIVAKNVRRFRLERDLTQRELADRAGMHRTYIGFIERGERKISVNILYDIAEALDLDVRRLVANN